MGEGHAESLLRLAQLKDVDLRLAGSSEDILARIQAAGALDLGDFMQFEVAPDPDTPEIVGDGVQYDGYRFRAECRLAGKGFGARFGVDIAFGGVLSGDVEEITTDDLLGFAGIAPPRLRVVPIETHLDAWTAPYARMAELDELPWRTLAEVAAASRSRRRSRPARLSAHGTA